MTVKNGIQDKRISLSENRLESFMTKTYVVVLAAMICCALWGSAFPCIKIGYRLFDIKNKDTFGQILFAGIRFILAGIFVIIFGSIAAKKPLLPSKKSTGKIMKLAVFQTIIQYLFFYIGLSNTSGVKASIINGASVFIAVFVSCIIFRLEKINYAKLAGSIIGFIGIILINLTGLEFKFTLSGDGFILISAIGYAMSSVLMKRYSVGESPVLLSGWQFVFGGAVMTAVGLIFGGRISFSSYKAVLILLYLALLSAVAYSIWSVLLKYNPVSKITVFGFMNPVFGTVFSVILLGETDAFGLEAIFALVLVSFGIYMVNREKLD